MDKPRIDPSSPGALDEVDRQLIAAVIRAPVASYAQWAQELGVSAHTVARRYRRLHSGGIVRVVGRTLPGFGGRLAWLMRIQASPDKLERAARELARVPTTRWVRFSLDGGELTCGALTTLNPEAEFLARLRAGLGQGAIHMHQLLTVWGAPGAVVTSPEPLDAADRHLLELLSRDGRASTTELAAQLGVDQATVSRRRSKLIANGVAYFEADIHPDALSRTGDALFWFQVSPGHVRALGEYLYASGVCRFVAACSGRYQLVANAIVESPRGLTRFYDSLADAPIPATAILGCDILPMGRALKRAG